MVEIVRSLRRRDPSFARPGPRGVRGAPRDRVRGGRSGSFTASPAAPAASAASLEWPGAASTIGHGSFTASPAAAAASSAARRKPAADLASFVAAALDDGSCPSAFAFDNNAVAASCAARDNNARPSPVSSAPAFAPGGPAGHVGKPRRPPAPAPRGQARAGPPHSPLQTRSGHSTRLCPQPGADERCRACRRRRRGYRLWTGRHPHVGAPPARRGQSRR